jgi:hypothetical protein
MTKSWPSRSNPYPRLSNFLQLKKLRDINETQPKRRPKEPVVMSNRPGSSSTTNITNKSLENIIAKGPIVGSNDKDPRSHIDSKRRTSLQGGGEDAGNFRKGGDTSNKINIIQVLEHKSYIVNNNYNVHGNTFNTGNGADVVKSYHLHKSPQV